MGTRKTFSPELYAENDARAIAAVLTHLHELGSFATKNDELYQPDILLFGLGFRKISYIEVEIKYNWNRSGPSGSFPFRTVQLPERKGKYLRKQLPIEFWILRPDLKYAIIIPDTAVTKDRLVEVPNKLVKQGELFYQIPVDECSQLELLQC